MLTLPILSGQSVCWSFRSAHLHSRVHASQHFMGRLCLFAKPFPIHLAAQNLARVAESLRQRLVPAQSEGTTTRDYQL